MGFIISLLIALLFSIWPLISIRKDKSNKKYYIICFIILLVGCFFRLFLIDRYPIGLHMDEVSIGYETYSLVENGIDRNGMSYPVNFIAWGSGQNALYGYLSMPFVKLLGLSSLSTRLVMALIGCLTLLLVYLFTKKYLKKEHSMLFLFMLAIMPWHVMKSRWSIESNIFPDLILYACMLMYMGIKSNKKRYYVFSSIIFGISTYAYGVSYLFVPLFMLVTFGYLIRKKIINWKHALLYLCITGLVAFPLIMYVFINFFKLDTIHIGPITIPRLYVNRMQAATILNYNETLLFRIAHNLFALIGIWIFQIGDSGYSGIPYFGVYYIISLPLLIYGIKCAIKSDDILLKIVNRLLICSIILGIFLYPTIVHLNIIWIPTIIYVTYGLIKLISKVNIVKFLIPVYVVLFICFIIYYYVWYPSYMLPKTNYSFDDALTYAEELGYDKLYIVSESYISTYYLFYKQMDTNYYLENRELGVEVAMFQYIKSIGNVYFYYPETMEDNIVIIVDKDERITCECPAKEFDNFIVYNCK